MKVVDTEGAQTLGLGHEARADGTRPSEFDAPVGEARDDRTPRGHRVSSTGRHLTQLAMGRSLGQQFLVANLVVLAVGMLVIGTWVGQAIARGVLNRSGALTALYVSSALGEDLHVLSTQARFDSNQIDHFDHLLAATPLGQRVVAFKVWSPDGEVLYSSDRRLTGQQFELDDGLEAALRGDVTAEVSDLTEAENRYERERWTRLVEVYAPIREGGASGRILGAVEFYQPTDELEGEIASARVNSWAVVGAVGLAMYLLLVGIVRRGSDTIARQRRALESQVVELRSLLDQNSRLHDRVRRAAEHTTALNEQWLRRISADLHDGPGQALGLASLRLHEVQADDADVAVVRSAVQDAMNDIRAISTGLRLPAVERLAPAELAQRAVDTHERRTGASVQLDVADAPAEAPVAVKIALFRALEEALSNASRHGRGLGMAATLRREHQGLRMIVRDEGPGFDPSVRRGEGHLGLLNMHERAELLGGNFEVTSAPGAGTTLSMWLPLRSESDVDGTRGGRVDEQD